MKVFNERFFEKSEHILEILQLWYKVQQTQLKNPENHHFQFILNKEAETDIKGFWAATSRYFYNNWDYHTSNAGTIMKVPTFQVELDKRSKNLLDEFNNFLNKAAISMGLSSKIDADLTISNGVCTNPYALIKEIMLRTAAQTLSAKGDQDDKNTVFLTILKEIVAGLSTISWLSKDVSLLVNKEKSSNFSIHFLGKIDAWMNSIECMIEEVKIINMVRNTIESNNAYLEALKKKVQRYIYIRLAMATQHKNPITSDCLKDWVESSLNELEEEILANNNSKSLEFNAERSIVTVKQKGNELCLMLKEKYQLSEIQIHKLEALYGALHTVSGIIHITDNIEELTTLMGSLPFIMKGIEAEELDRYFTACVQQCNDACRNDDLENTIIHAVESSNIIPKYSKLPFGNLSNIHITDKITSKIKLTILDLQSNCNFFGFHGVVVDSFVSQLALTKGSKALPEHAQSQLPVNPSNDSSTKEKNTVVELKSSFTILQALGLERSVLSDLLREMQNNQDNFLWEYMKQEVLMFMENKELPHALTRVLSEQPGQKFDTVGYHKPFLQLNAICKKLRNDMYKNSEQERKLLAKSDYDLLQHLIKEKSPYLKTYNKEIAEYERIKNNSSLILAESCTNKTFILAYFKYYYIDNANDLVYIPNVPSSIKAIAEHCRISVVFEEKLDAGIINIDDCNSCENPAKVIYIDYQKGHVTPIVAEPQKPMSTTKALPIFSANHHYQDKTALNDFLFSTLENEAFSPENKKRALEYFFTENKTLADSGITAALQSQKAAQCTLDEFKKNDKNLDAEILNAGTKYIFENIVQFINSNLLEKGDVKVNGSLLNKIKHQFNMVVDEFVYEAFLSTIQNSAYQTYPLVHLKKTSLMLLNEQISSDTQKLSAFKTNPLIHYARDQDGQFIVFQENPIPQDGECALNAIEMPSRANLVRVLIEAIKNPENRAFLGEEIFYEYRTISTSGHEHAIDLHPSPKWKDLYLKWAELESQLGYFRQFFIDYTDGATPELLLMRLQSRLVFSSMTNKEKAQVAVLEDTIKEHKRYSDKMMLLCTEEDVCKHYVKQFEKKGVWVGSCALSIYARETGFNLLIYGRVPAKSGVSFAKLDAKRSYISNKEGADTKYIVFNNKNHFDKLVPSKTEATPIELIDAYQLALKNTLIAVTQKVCMPKENMALSEFQKLIKEHSTQYIAKATLSEEEKEIIEKSNQCMLQAEVLDMEIKERNKKWEDIQRQGQFTNYLNEFKKYQDMAVLVDEPRTRQNETLLYKTIQTNQRFLVDFLLGMDASVISLNGEEIGVSPKGAKIVKNCMYLLSQTEQKAWVLSYRATPTAEEEVINIQNVRGLELELAQAKNPEDAIAKVTIYSLLDRYHRSNKHPRTPLMLAAQCVGFSNIDSLFFTLLTKANKKAVSKSNDVKQYEALSYCSKSMIPDFNTKLQDYRNVQEERSKSTMYRIGQALRYMVNADLSRERAEELAFAYEYLVNGEDGHDYNVMLHQFNHLLGQIQNKGGSVFYKSLYDTVTTHCNWMTANIKQYRTDFYNYQISMNVAVKANQEAFQQELDKKVQESNRKAEEAKQETQELRRENQEIKRQAEEAKQETQELRRENQEIRKKIEASDRKTEKANRRFESLMEQLFSLHPEFQNSDINKEVENKKTQPNNANLANRLFTTTPIEINETADEESEVISKKSVRVRSQKQVYVSDEDSSSDYNPYVEKLYI